MTVSTSPTVGYRMRTLPHVGFGLRVAIELDQGGPRREWMLLSSTVRDELAHGDIAAKRIVRFCAPDLGSAQRIHRRLRTATDLDWEHRQLTMVDLHVHIGSDIRLLLTEFEREGQVRAGKESLRYVGTATGLAGLISDIHAAGVADGVTLIPIKPEESLEPILYETLPNLVARGTLSHYGGSVAGAATWARQLRSESRQHQKTEREASFT
jgi:hypothetical protein